MANLTIERRVDGSKHTRACDIQTTMFITAIIALCVTPIAGIVALRTLTVIMFPRAVVGVTGFTIRLSFMGEFCTSPRIRAVTGRALAAEVVGWFITRMTGGAIRQTRMAKAGTFPGIRAVAS